MKSLFIKIAFALSLFLFHNSLLNSVLAQEPDYYTINNSCIGYVCIGDTIEEIENKYADHIIKVNDDETGYYIFDQQGNFLVEFSTKKSLNSEKAPIRYIMTSNPIFSFEPGGISLETKVSELINKYGHPIYEPGPNGYFVSFKSWPIKETYTHKNFEINFLVGVFNPKLTELFKLSGSINEKAEIKLLEKYPDVTILNTIEIFSDALENGKPL